jgi:lipopolysaccharide biosynthesis glycosyltransferase
MNSHWAHGQDAFSADAGGKAAVVLVTDENYFLPTFSAALSADAHISRPGFEICLFVVGADDEWARQFDGAVRGTKIRVIPADLAELARHASFHRDRYLPPIALARFWISSLLDPDVDRLLYIDGDVMVDDELDSLLSSPPPVEGLMVGQDFVNIFIGEVGVGRWRDVQYLRAIGCDAEFYFNSGVIYASRQAWDRITPVATRFLRERPDLCIASDQTALNYASRDAVTLLPLHFNYQSDHMMMVDPRNLGLKATIWHFTGAPKPWNSTGWPWDEYFNRFYRLAEARLSGCDVATPVPPEKQITAGLAHRARARFRLKWVYPWRMLNRRRKIVPLLLKQQVSA